MTNVSEELARLAALRDQGVLTDAEFEQQKAAVLAGGGGGDRAVPAAAKSKSAAGKGCLIIIGILVLLAVIGAIVGGGSTDSGNKSDTATVKAAVEPLAVTAAEVATAYEDNEARAQQTYGDRPLLVTATLAGVQIGLSDEPFLNLKTNGFVPANAELDDAGKAKASSLNKGEKIVLLCQGVSEVVAVPQFKSCALQ